MRTADEIAVEAGFWTRDAMEMAVIDSIYSDVHPVTGGTLHLFRYLMVVRDPNAIGRIPGTARAAEPQLTED
jgi:hypothetical protein